MEVRLTARALGACATGVGNRTRRHALGQTCIRVVSAEVLVRRRSNAACKVLAPA